MQEANPSIPIPDSGRARTQHLHSVACDQFFLARNGMANVVSDDRLLGIISGNKLADGRRSLTREARANNTGNDVTCELSIFKVT